MFEEDQVGTPLARGTPAWALIGCAILTATAIVGGILVLVWLAL